MRQRNSNSIIRDLATLGAVAAAGYAFRSIINGRRAHAQQGATPGQQRSSSGRTVSSAPNSSFDAGAGSNAVGLDSAPVESRTLPNTPFAPEDDQPY
jgi:hypothetical protein